MDDSGISMILYDTNSDEDININEKILEKFRPNNSVSSIKNGTPPALESPVPPPTETTPPKEEKEAGPEVMKDLMAMDLASLKPIMPATMPEVGEFLDVNITLAASPSNFTVSEGYYAAC